MEHFLFFADYFYARRLGLPAGPSISSHCLQLDPALLQLNLALLAEEAGLFVKLMVF
jgi:hypothetical protein